MINRKTILVFVVAVLAFCISVSCKRASSSGDNFEKVDRFEVLISYIEENHDFINSPESPAAVNAIEVYQMLNDNIHIIDVRTPEEFAEGRVPGSVNVPLPEIIDYFENKIDPASFEKIFLFSKDHQESMVANGVLHMLGYDNTFNVRWGMSSWNSEYADKGWSQVLGSGHTDYLTTEPYPKNEPGPYPEVYSRYITGYDILRERAQKLLQKPHTDFFITAEEVMKNPDDYYLINYWSKADYDIAHLEGAIQYDPKKSLKRDAELNTLPIDQTIVLYCYSNSTTPIVFAYLHLLGYNVKTIAYGSNSFMYDVMVEKIRSFFTYNVVNEFPVETDDSVGIPDVDVEENTFVVPDAGC